MRKFGPWVVYLFLVATFLIFVAVAVNAQGLEPSAPVPSWLPLVQEIVILIVSGFLIPVAIQYLRSRGLQIEEKHAAHIQLTAENAAALMLDPALSMEERRRVAMQYLYSGAEDAINYFKADPDRLFQIVMSHYNKLKPSL